MTSDDSRILLKVKKVGEEITDKGRKYKVELEGCNDYIDVKVTLKSDFQYELKRMVPLTVGESRYMDLETVNKTLNDFAPEDIRAAERSKMSREALQEGNRLVKEMDVALQKRKQAAVEQAGGE